MPDFEIVAALHERSESPQGFGVRWVRGEGTHRFGFGPERASQSGVSLSDRAPPATLGNWMQIRFSGGRKWIGFSTGNKSNRHATGGWLKVRVRGHTLSRQVMPTRRYVSQSELPVTIGLGEADKVDCVGISWPSGGTQRTNPPPMDPLAVITEPR